jgi:hypothetical protein
VAPKTIPMLPGHRERMAKQQCLHSCLTQLAAKNRHCQPPDPSQHLDTMTKCKHTQTTCIRYTQQKQTATVSALCGYHPVENTTQPAQEHIGASGCEAPQSVPHSTHTTMLACHLRHRRCCCSAHTSGSTAFLITLCQAPVRTQACNLHAHERTTWHHTGDMLQGQQQMHGLATMHV